MIEATARDRALEIAREVGRRTCDRERIARAVAFNRKQTAFPEGAHWSALSVAQGEVGLALLLACLDASFPEDGWDRQAHGYLQSAAQSLEGMASPPIGAFGGLAGLSLVVDLLSRGGTRYRRLQGEIDTALAKSARDAGEQLHSNVHDLSVHQFDAISGLAGTAACMLARQDTDELANALAPVIEALCAVASVDGLPAWYTPPERIANPDMRAEFAEGNLNCGLAHGIPGPLAALALAYKAGMHNNGLVEERIRGVADWLLAHRVDDAWGTNWPAAIPVATVGGARRAILPQEVHAHFGKPLHPTHAAWCYGSPGVARALWLAGDALDEPRYRDAALEAVRAICARPWQARQISSPTFCHGVSGLAHIVLRFAQDTDLPWLWEASRAMLDMLLELYEPDSVLGFRAHEPEGRRIDRPGFLDGAPGVAAALLAFATDRAPCWDRVFLLS
ncbi:MAG: lanthionine synthetase C family protein [Alphaproteobacteria bacterium]|nr:lanthionine synthetase C family protein [Alphaproteobacteria bacterium]